MSENLFTKPSLTLRIGIGKLVGLLFGLAGFVLLPILLPNVDMMLRWGVLLWYPTLGAIIGVFGIYTSHPVLRLPLPWWVRAPLIGAWMNFVLTLFVYDAFHAMMLTVFGALSGFWTSPFWFVVEGALVGLIIGWLATRFGGEGTESARH